MMTTVFNAKSRTHDSPESHIASGSAPSASSSMLHATEKLFAGWYFRGMGGYDKVSLTAAGEREAVRTYLALHPDGDTKNIRAHEIAAGELHIRIQSLEKSAAPLAVELVKIRQQLALIEREMKKERLVASRLPRKTRDGIAEMNFQARDLSLKLRRINTDFVCFSARARAIRYGTFSSCAIVHCKVVRSYAGSVLKGMNGVFGGLDSVMRIV